MNFGIVGFPRKAFPVSKPDGTQGEMTLRLLHDDEGNLVFDGEATMTIKLTDGEEWLITEAMFEQALAGMRAARFWQLGHARGSESTTCKVIGALEEAYHPQNPLSMNPADFITKRFKAPGHEGLEER